MNEYGAFLDRKAQYGDDSGFEPSFVPRFLFHFQQALVEWSVRKGRAAIFADCGLGKTAMQLAWAENIVRQTGKRVLILTPLAVSYQTLTEAEKFGLEVRRSQDGSAQTSMTVTNYERLGAFSSRDFCGVVCDESSILKSFDGVRRREITEFMRRLPYRLLCTATAAPNDYPELGTSSEALGALGYMDMLNRFFRNTHHTSAVNRYHGKEEQWRLKKHAELPFWRWVCSWARAVRQPSDLGCENGPFVLPPLMEQRHIVRARTRAEGMLFDLPAVGLKEQLAERKRTIRERCEAAAALVAETGQPAVVWCQLNPEGDWLEKLIPDAKQVSGKHSDDQKEGRLRDFAAGNLRVLITKPKIGAWGLNLQHCAHVVYFPSHSYEQYYQAVRRCWRFGQTRPVTVDMVMTEGDEAVMANLQRKAEQVSLMFDALVAQIQHALRIDRGSYGEAAVQLPPWL